MDKGPSLSKFVKKAVEAIEGTGLKHQVTPMGTVIEAGTLEEIFSAARAAVDAVAEEGSQRISLSLKVDIRFDREISMDSKIRSLERL
ncbi:MAG: MTH1187 family thiamine-binding protein [Thermoplasmatota archaeon]